ncbi:hypothetical protein ABIF65_009238 [Bradyrhizobium japonicum]|uniref:hypothetical protein n=1 Tax=Bradyrhizobium liaoningense TaxID=43992 RepID=UPI001BA458E9|nr:hypothetical protein [Bradyrhizobium liaoningense]MBR1033266.1 hypothetical protein [Bradyrhizobium liaoningense]MDI2078236.1 hypothetical protein [Bradyrhizobium sp. Mp27]
MNSPKIEFANTLRAIAALSVILGHYLGVFWFNHSAVKQLTGMAAIPLPTPSYVQWVQIPHLRAGPGCLDSAPLDLSGFLPGYAERGALRFCRCVGRA